MILSILQMEKLSLKFGRSLIWTQVRVTQSPSTNCYVILYYKSGLGKIKFGGFLFVRFLFLSESFFAHSAKLKPSCTEKLLL